MYLWGEGGGVADLGLSPKKIYSFPIHYVLKTVAFCDLDFLLNTKVVINSYLLHIAMIFYFEQLILIIQQSLQIS